MSAKLSNVNRHPQKIFSSQNFLSLKYCQSISYNSNVLIALGSISVLPGQFATELGLKLKPRRIWP